MRLIPHLVFDDDELAVFAATHGSIIEWRPESQDEESVRALAGLVAGDPMSRQRLLLAQTALRLQLAVSRARALAAEADPSSSELADRLSAQSDEAASALRLLAAALTWLSPSEGCSREGTRWTG